jgi:peptidoglycan/LPS O-acetylase OafA/YrhL
MSYPLKSSTVQGLQVVAEVPNPGRHVPALDGIRGIAILLVLMTNLYGGPANHFFEAGVAQVFHAGWIGVNLFFVLSGFLITGILYDAKDGRHYFRNFYARRFLRIFPLYYAALLVWLFVLPALGWFRPGEAETFRHHQWWYWTYLSNIHIAFAPWPMGGEPTHFWSLAVEEQFYLIWPVVVALADRRRLVIICTALVLTAFSLRVGWRLVDSGLTSQHALHFLTVARMDELALGGLLAVGVRTPNALAWVRRWAGPAALTTTAALLALFVWQRGLYPYSFIVQTLGRSLVALAAGGFLVLAATATVGTVPHTVFVHPLLRFLGRYSYGIYVWHELMVPFREPWARAAAGVLGSEVPAALGAWLVLAACATCLGVLSWHFYEKHFLKLKPRFPYHRSRKATLPASAPGRGA